MVLGWNLVSRLAVTGIFAAALAGCASTALQPGKSVLDVQDARNSAALNNLQPQAAFPPHPSGFDWATQSLRATGQGTASEGMPAAQRDVAARASATAHAKANLKEQVKALPVGTDQTVGSIMNSYITIRVAIEQEIAGAKVIGTSPSPTGPVEAEVEMPMQKIATILQQHQITPHQELPAMGETAANVSDII